MVKLDDVAKASARASLYLFLGETSSVVIMAITSIFVARFLGSENYGLYNVALILPMLLGSMCDVGISPSLIRFPSKFCSEDKYGKAASLIKTGIMFKMFLSLFVSLTLFLLSESIATNLFQRPQISILIRLASLYLLGSSVLQTVNSAYVGLDKTEKCGLLMNVAAITKAITSISLILIGFGVIGATLGIGLSSMLACGIGVSLLLWRTIPTLCQRSCDENINFSEGIRLMVTYGRPLYFSALLFNIFSRYQGFILALFASNIEIGEYAAAMNFSILITLLSQPIATSLFPAFSKLTIEDDRVSLGKMFRLSVKYTSLLVIPASLALILFSRQLVYTLYGAQFELAPGYLAFYAAVFLCAGLGTIVTSSFFNGQGDTWTTFKINLVKLAILVPLVPFLTIHYGVPGLIASILASEFLSAIYGLSLIHRKYGIALDSVSSLRIAVASIFSALTVYIFLRLFPLSNHLYKLAAGGPLYLVTLLIVTPLLGAINEVDTKNLDDLTRQFNLIHPIAQWILSFEKKLIRLRAFFLSKIFVHSYMHDAK